MRIALIGDFDTYLLRGLERPQQLLPYRLSPGLNLLRGFRELGVKDIHILVDTTEVKRPTVDEGPLGILHRLPCPRFSGSACFHLWRRHALLRELARLQPDILHGQGTEAEYAFTAVTSRFPNVITIHGIMHRVHQIVPPRMLTTQHVARWLENLVVRKARHAICISRAVEQFLQMRASPARCHLVPNAIAPHFFEVQPPTVGHTQPTLLFVGTVYPLKGLLHLVEALPPLQQLLGQPVRLIIVGKGGSGGKGQAYESLIRKRAADLRLETQVEWWGWQDERGVARALAASHVLVLPSFEETFSMCIAEAMAARVPVVASRVGGVTDLITHGSTGLLVSPGNSHEIAEAVHTVLRDSELRSQLVTNAHDAALNRYAPRVVAAKTLEVYQAIAREAAGRQN